MGHLAHRSAHEEQQEGTEEIRSAYILGAAQWILWYGQSLFKQVLYPGDPPEDLRPWNPGPLYDGKASLSLHRWHFWRDSYKAIASGERQGEESFSQECKDIAAKAVSMVDSFERNMSF